MALVTRGPLKGVRQGADRTRGPLINIATSALAGTFLLRERAAEVAPTA